MSLLAKLERIFGRFAVPHVTIALIVGQVIVYGLAMTSGGKAVLANLVDFLSLIPQLVLAGEAWRLVTFLIVPPFTNVVFAFFFWYLFYLMGTALENHWGAFRYNVYLLIGYVATVAVSFLTPNWPASNGYLQASVFLAFAALYPDFELYLFFVLPVKIKWLACLTGIGYFATVVLGDWTERLLVLASVCNFLLFFGWDIVDRVRTGRRRMAIQAAQFAVKERPYFHRCMTCGITDRTNPKMDFRYCSQCEGACGYCTDHLHDHQHVVTQTAAPG